MVVVKMILKLVLISALLGFSVEVERGDIIRYPGHCYFYNHYAVYVGEGLNNALPNKTAVQDTFEMTRENGCVFGNLRDPYEVFNYMENRTNGPVVKPRSWDEMARSITNMYKRCGTWKFSNTCEHIATKIRYGDGHSECNQYKTIAHPLCYAIEKGKRRTRPVQTE